MDPEIKTILQENLRISHENNEMILSLVKYQKQQKTLKIIYWVLIILVTFGSLFFIQPLLGSLISLYTGGAGDTSSVSSYSDILKNLSGNQQATQNLLNGN